MAKKQLKAPAHYRDIVVMGASAGGLEAITEAVAGLPANLHAAIFVALHTAAGGPGLVPTLLQRRGPLPAQHAVDGLLVRAGRIYVAPPDHHLLLNDSRMSVTRGPKENGFRPAVDPLFRTAARAYGDRVIGVILSGALDDGTLGLQAIKRAGGLAIAQHPDDALYPGMPVSAIRSIQVDHILRAREIAAVIVQHVRVHGATRGNTMPKGKAPVQDRARSGTNKIEEGALPGPPSALTCPECGGALWEAEDGQVLLYRCHLGHGFTADGLVEDQRREVEEALWSALRALEEHAALRRRMARRPTLASFPRIAEEYELQAQDAEQRGEAIRRLLLTDALRAGESQKASQPGRRQIRKKTQ